MKYVPPTPEELEIWREENRLTLKELCIYYGSWDELRKEIEDIEQSEAESAYESMVEDFYGGDKPFTMDEQHQDAYKHKYNL